MKNYLKHRIKITLKIVATNWIHIVGFLVTTYLSLIIFKLLQLNGAENTEWFEVIFSSLATIPLLFIIYGPIIIGGFYIVMFILDLIGFNIKIKNVQLILIIEWLIIVTPFLYWAFEYQYWLWITLSISLLVTQLKRKKKIEKIKRENEYKNCDSTGN